jgi:fatty acid desaturase
LLPGYGCWSFSTRSIEKRPCYYSTKQKSPEQHFQVSVLDWLTIGFWGCALMWLISLAGDVGLARNPEVAEGLQWLPLISAIIAFIGMCHFGHVTSMFGW